MPDGTGACLLYTSINTSINLANSAVKVDDYGCYTFGILKALDAVLRTRLLEDADVYKRQPLQCPSTIRRGFEARFGKIQFGALRFL